MPAEAPAAGLPPGHRIAEYEIVRVLGAGGFGITYLAFDHQLDGPVALKEYFPADLAARVDGARVAVTAPTNRETFSWGLERFLEEARAIHRFRHPNVVQVHRYLEANETAYIVMEYVEGESLKSILDRRGRLSAEEWRPWLNALLDGLEHVHSHGYLHRDIKPANIVIRAATGEPVLIDFGSARVQQRERTHTQVLTAGYAPIEQYSGGGSQGPPSDIYALAAVSYRALTGSTVASAPDRVLDDSYLPLPEQVVGADSRWLAAIEHGLALRPQARPQSVEDWRQALGSADAASANKANAAPLEAVRRRPSDKAKNSSRNEPLPTPDEALDAPEKTPAGARSRHLWWAVPALFTTALVILRLAISPIGGSKASAGPDWVAALERQRSLAAKAFQRAAEGHANAQFNLAGMYANGRGVPQDHEQAARWFQLAAEQDHAEAQFNLGNIYATGEGVPQDDEEAARWYRRAAEQGHARAQYSLAGMYASGRGVPQDDEEAARWYRRAAEQGHARAQYSLAGMYASGRGVPQDDEEAARWYRRAAEQGHARAQYSLGFTYAVGWGVPQDGEEAARWYRRAAEQGHARAQYSLGFTYTVGWGVPQDGEEAARWYRRAAEQGIAWAQFNLGLMYASGRGVPRDDEEAVRRYRRAADRGHARAQSNLGYMYASGRGVPRDNEEAARWYRRAAEQGLARAQVSLGMMYPAGNRYAYRAVRWLRRAADQGHAQAQSNLGYMYASGRHVPQDDEEAARWYRRAADQGHAQAQSNLAGMYASGRGVPQDDEEAARWYRRAADQGHAQAQSNLAGMYASGRGVPQDDEEAARWYRRAADQGHAQAQSNLAGMYADGRGVSQDDVAAHMWTNLAEEGIYSEEDMYHWDYWDDVRGGLRWILEERMSAGQIAAAQRAAREWRSAQQ